MKKSAKYYMQNCMYTQGCSDLTSHLLCVGCVDFVLLSGISDTYNSSHVRQPYQTLKRYRPVVLNLREAHEGHICSGQR
jgi:hypothetical protein